MSIFKILLICVGLISLTAFSIGEKKKLISTFTIGKFSYSIFEKEIYMHDDDANGNFFVVYKKGGLKEQCGAYHSVEKNGKVLVKGTFYYNNRFIRFKECTLDKSYWGVDSSLKWFYPNKKGDLILIQVIDYKDGVAEKTKY